MTEPTARKSIFITGAASGMGLATARLFAARGWFVGAYDVDETGLDSLQVELGSERCLARHLDVTDREGFARALTEFAARTGGRLDVLFNNAGIGKAGYFDEQPIEDVLAVVNVNFIGVLNGIHLAAPLLSATTNSLCFTTSSSSATFGMPGIAVYSATKHAVKGLTEALSIEMARHGVRVADTLPGLVDTPLLPESWKQNAEPQGMWRLVPPEEIAATVWSAYHDDTGRLHWYVPEGIAELDRAATLDPEGTRAGLATGGALDALADQEPASDA